jgi:hypothetical protein
LPQSDTWSSDHPLHHQSPSPPQSVILLGLARRAIHILADQYLLVQKKIARVINSYLGIQLSFSLVKREKDGLQDRQLSLVVVVDISTFSSCNSGPSSTKANILFDKLDATSGKMS